MGILHFVMGLTILLGQAQPAGARDPEQQAGDTIHQVLGVKFAIAESKLRRSIIRTKTPYGFKISHVEKDSRTARAGWKEGDILLEWNGQPLKTLTEMNTALQKAKQGEAVKFKLARYKEGAPMWSRQPWEYLEDKLVVKP